MTHYSYSVERPEDNSDKQRPTVFTYNDNVVVAPFPLFKVRQDNRPNFWPKYRT